MLEIVRSGLEQDVSVEKMVDILSRSEADLDRSRVRELATLLEGFIRSVPDALSVPIAMMKDPRCGRAVSFATGQILMYLFDEDDLLPDHAFGCAGLLDDAYLAHAYATLLATTYPGVSVERSRYQPASKQTLDVVRDVLPAGVAQALSQTCQSILSIAMALFGDQAVDGAVPGERSLPTLRVREAIETVDA